MIISNYTIVIWMGKSWTFKPEKNLVKSDDNRPFVKMSAYHELDETLLMQSSQATEKSEYLSL